MRKYLCYLLTLFTVWSCKAQVPDNRPSIQEQAFDDRLTSLLSFSIPLIGVEELHGRESDFLILDTREQEEFELSHIPGAQYVGYDSFNADALTTVDRDQPIVLYCSVGYRSEKIGEKLQRMGFTKVYNLYGSIFEWANQGYPLITQTGDATRSVHTYNRKWSRWLTNPAMEKVW
jgi:rhodanese-related sulfurtransferase